MKTTTETTINVRPPDATIEYVLTHELEKNIIKFVKYWELSYLIQIKSGLRFTKLSGVNLSKKVIQIWGVKLSTQISHDKNFFQKSYPKNILSKDLLDLFYITLYTKRNHPKIYNYVTYYT